MEAWQRRMRNSKKTTGFWPAVLIPMDCRVKPGNDGLS
jgi:hypothetical protein